MKLEDQVCGLELAKKLKELGVKQESIFAWAEVNQGGNNWKYQVVQSDFQADCEYISAFTVAELGEMLPLYLKRDANSGLPFSVVQSDFQADCEYISAFTVAELGEMLPLYLKRDANSGLPFSVERCGLQTYKTYDGKGWVVCYDFLSRSGRTEANARAKMLIYLLENKLINL